MPYSALVYRDLPPEVAPARATVIPLHGHNGHLDDLVPLARALGPDVRVVAPEAARGVYDFRDLVARTWYGGWQMERPDPASFGDSLAQLERFLHDVRERAGVGEPALPWLLGYDQGAVLALTAAVVVPDLLAGVMAVGGCLPTFSDPGLLDAVASSLPVLLVGDPADTTLPATAVEATGARLAGLGVRVTTEWIEGARGLGPAVGAALQTWLDHRIGR